MIVWKAVTNGKSLPSFIVWIGYLELTTYCGTQVDASLSYEGEFCALS